MLLLVGVTGMHLDLGLVRRRGSTAVLVSAGGLIVPLGLGVGTAFLLPAALVPDGTERGVFALFLGVAMCVSAIPVIAKTLMEMRLLHRTVGQLTLTAGVIDDVFGWFTLSVVSSIAVTGMSGAPVVEALASVALVAVVALTAGRWAVRHTFRLVGRSPEPGRRRRGGRGDPPGGGRHPRAASGAGSRRVPRRCPHRTGGRSNRPGWPRCAPSPCPCWRRSSSPPRVFAWTSAR
ncbi:cation:proton antiporter [Streptomyces nogalater]